MSRVSRRWARSISPITHVVYSLITDRWHRKAKQLCKILCFSLLIRKALFCFCRPDYLGLQVPLLQTLIGVCFWCLSLRSDFGRTVTSGKVSEYSKVLAVQNDGGSPEPSGHYTFVTIPKSVPHLNLVIKFWKQFWPKWVDFYCDMSTGRPYIAAAFLSSWI